MKKVLILAYDFPPYTSVGAQRPYSWFKYFKKYNIEPIVVSRNWDGIQYNSIEAFTQKTSDQVNKKELAEGTIYYTPYKPDLRDHFLQKDGQINAFIRRCLSLFYTIARFVSFRFDNRKSIYDQARKVLQEDDSIEVIIATGEPFILFKYAHLLSKEFSIPWHADYRDDWINNHSQVNASILVKLTKRIEAIWEKKYLSNVASISSVSTFIVDEILKRTGVKNGYVIENGVDLDLVRDNSVSVDNDFLISYTGIMYDFPYMVPFKEGFTQFLSKNNFDPHIQLQFIGIDSQDNQAVALVRELVNMFPQHCSIKPRVSMAESIQIQSSSRILLNLIAGDPSKGLVGAKVYSYAAVKRPILSITSHSNMRTFFFEGRNIHTVVNSGEGVLNFLEKYYVFYKQGITFETDIYEDEIRKLSREYNVKLLSQYLAINK